MQTITCDACGKVYRLKSTPKGKRVKCRKCGHSIALSTKPRDEEEFLSALDDASAYEQTSPAIESEAVQRSRTRNEEEQRERTTGKRTAGWMAIAFFVVALIGGITFLTGLGFFFFGLLGSEANLVGRALGESGGGRASRDQRAIGFVLVVLGAVIGYPFYKLASKLHYSSLTKREKRQWKKEQAAIDRMIKEME